MRPAPPLAALLFALALGGALAPGGCRAQVRTSSSTLLAARGDGAGRPRRRPSGPGAAPTPDGTAPSLSPPPLSPSPPCDPHRRPLTHRRTLQFVYEEPVPAATFAEAEAPAAAGALPADPRAVCLPALAEALEFCIPAYAPPPASASPAVRELGYDGMARERCCNALHTRFATNATAASAGCLCVTAVAQAAADVLQSYTVYDVDMLLTDCTQYGQTGIGWDGGFAARRHCPAAAAAPDVRTVFQNATAKAAAIDREIERLGDDLRAYEQEFQDSAASGPPGLAGLAAAAAALLAFAAA